MERFKALIPYINAPLVYNGDIVSVESFERISIAVQPVKQFMLGRGLLANPFLAEQIKNDMADTHGTDTRGVSLQGEPVGTHRMCPQSNDKTERLHHYIIDLYEDRLRHAGGSPKVLGRMKELWSYLMNSFESPQDVWRKIKKINALQEYEEAVEEIFRNIEITEKP